MDLKVEGRRLLKNKKQFFYFADTCWSAFTNIEDSEWEYYLDYRKNQGFNTLQINILPQWDASEALYKRSPFNYDSEGKIDIANIDHSYFERSREMSMKAVEKGFSLSLVALWCNYVPNTWASNMKGNDILPFDFLESYADIIERYFGDLASLFMISGDTDFSDESNLYYLEMSRLIKNKCPNILQTMHIKGRLQEIPQIIDDCVDLYFYQSGHNRSDLRMPYLLSEYFYNNYKEKPIINSEPCYEQMGYSRKEYGRWSQQDVRRAAWQSILSGASAGITYGASGIYSWHRTSSNFDSLLGEAFDKPNSWNQALTYPGAWDYSFLKYFLNIHSIDDITPRNDLLLSNKEGVRVGETQDYIIIYVPFSTELHLSSFSYPIEGIIYDLSSNKTSNVKTINGDKTSIITQHNFLHDVVIVLNKEEK